MLPNSLLQAFLRQNGFMMSTYCEITANLVKLQSNDRSSWPDDIHFQGYGHQSKVMLRNAYSNNIHLHDSSTHTRYMGMTKPHENKARCVFLCNLQGPLSLSNTGSATICHVKISHSLACFIRLRNALIHITCFSTINIRNVSLQRERNKIMDVI